jgi:hypothetical protein
MTEEKPTPKSRPDPYVTLVATGDHRDVIYLTSGEPVRFSHEGTARVPESVAQRLVGPGWHVRYTRP